MGRLAPIATSSFLSSRTIEAYIHLQEDSLRLFRDLVSSPILKDVNIILFLNKVDLLDAKLKSGIRLAQYFKRYGDRPNDTEAVLKCAYSPFCLRLVIDSPIDFRAKFSAIHEKYTPTQASRVFTIHETSLIDRQSTKVTLQAGTCLLDHQTW